MPVFVDPRSGKRYEHVPDKDVERARTEFGLVSEEEYAHQRDVEAADQGILSAAGKGVQHGLGVIQDIARTTGFQPPIPGSEAFGPGGQLQPPGFGAPGLQPPAPPPGEETFPQGFDEQARLEREAHPFAFGAGAGLPAVPLAAIAGAGAGALGGPAVLGAAVGGVLTESAVEGAVQEYSDAWFESRPFELKNVAANTLFFTGLDFAFRGALRGIGSALTGKPAAKPSFGSRNVVSEAQGAARELVDPVGGGSVGAARAVDLEDEFDTAIKQMSDRDAAVLSRDADAHYHLIAQDASESFTRLNNGLSDDLGNRLKYEDFATYADEFDTATLERQAKWWTGVSEGADDAARSINALAEGDATALDFGNLGKKAARILDDFNRRINESVDPGRRIVEIDSFKKTLDRITMSIDASHSVDTVTRSELKALIAPTREALRKGLENARLFGGAADLQRSLNKPWHDLLEHWSKVQRTLTEETGHVQFDVSGAGRITRESTVDRMLSLLGKDPRSNQEFGRHLAGALDNIQGLIDARRAHGITRLDGLDALESDIRNLAEDWNLASTIGVAKNRVESMKKDPRKWASIALDMGERLPMVGAPIKMARTLGDAFTDLHIQRGTPLARVWDSAYKRYALNPAFQDPSILRNYPDWIADSLRNRGGSFTPPAGAVGTPAMPGALPANEGAIRNVAQPPQAVPQALRDRVGPGGVHTATEARKFLAGKQGVDDLAGMPVNRRVVLSGGDAGLEGVSLEPTGKQPAVMQGGIDPLGRAEGEIPGDLVAGNAPTFQAAPYEQVPIPAHDIFTPHVGSLAENGIFRERLSGAGGKTPGGWFRGADGVVRYIKADRDAAHSAIEVGNNKMYAALGRRVTDMQQVRLPSGEVAVASPDLGRNWVDLSQVPDWSALPKSVRDSYAEGVPIDYIMGNWDVGRNANNIKTDGVTTAMVDAGEAASNAWSATKWYKGNPAHIELELERTRAAARGQVPATEEEALLDPLWGAVPGGTPSHALLNPYAGSRAELRALMARSFDRALGVIDEAGGPEGFIRRHQPTLDEGAAKRSAKEMADRIKAFRAALPFFAATVYLAFGGTAEAAEPPPPPLAPPEAAYRDALKEIEQAGQRQARELATEALRRKPRGKDRGPLTLFAGKGSIRDAIEATRERLEEIAGDPSSLLQQLGESAGALGKTHPSVYMAVVEKTAQIAAYLQAAIPQRTAATLLDPRGAPISFDRGWDFAARFVGATQPRAALREVTRGTAPPEMLEAVQQNWPELWDAFRVETLGQVQRMHGAGRHIPSEKLRRLDRLLGLNGQLDPSASLEVAQHLIAAQGAEVAKRQQAGQATGAVSGGASGASQFRTRLDALNKERRLSP